MAMHFTQSKKYRDLSLPAISKITEEDAWQRFVIMRWGSLTTMPCPACGVVDEHYPRRTRRQWRCKHCNCVFSVTTDTPFADRKLSFQQLLLIIYLFVVEPKGISANKHHAIVGVTLRTMYLNLQKIREAIFETMDLTPMEGAVQIDGAHCCGKPRRHRRRKMEGESQMVNHKLRNRKASIDPTIQKQHMSPANRKRFKNRRIIIVFREIPGEPGKGAKRTITKVVLTENQKNVIQLVRKYVKPGSQIDTDGGVAFLSLIAWYDHRIVNHSIEYSTDDGINNNQAESYISRLRRAEYGVYHGFRPQYLAFYAAEFAWREDVRRFTIREKLENIFQKIFQCGISYAFRRYSQGHRLKMEYLG